MRFRLFCSGAAVIFTACVFETKQAPALPGKRLSYTVHVLSGDGKSSRCSVEVDILAWPGNERRVFQFPAYYPDNPRMPVPGVLMGAVKAKDWLGRPVAVREAFPPFSQGGGGWMDLGDAQSFHYEIDLEPSNPDRFGPPAPGLKPGTQLLDGSQLFALPAAGFTLAEHWRNPVFMRMEWRLDRNTSLVGGAYWDFSSNYEMMFFRGALNPVKAENFLTGSHRVTLYTTSPDEILPWDEFENNLGRWIRRVEKALLPLPWKNIYVGTNSIHSGIEGMAGYWFQSRYSGAAEVHLHELLHSIIGVAQGELEDAWWKEGVTTYLGRVLTAWDGYYDSTDLKSSFLQDWETVPSVRDFSLADPALRDRFYSELTPEYQDLPREDFYSLLYGKGAQAGMLLDAWLLQNSAGRKGLFDAVRLLYRPGQGGFNRQQFVAVLESLTGVRADTLLQSICDRPGVYDSLRLRTAFDTLRVLGRFQFHADSIDIIHVMPRRAARPKPGEWLHLKPDFKL